MHYSNVEAVSQAAGDGLGINGLRHTLPCSVLGLRTRLSRFSLMLGVYAAIGTAGIPLIAAAAPYQPARGGTAVAAVHGVKPGRSRVSSPHAAHAAFRRSRDMRMAGVSRPAHPGHSAGLSRATNSDAARGVSAVHRGLVPLANTTWDNPAMPPTVRDAIQTAAREAGVDPHLLTAIAWRESRFDPNALNRQSSAKGLLQFTSGTWLRAVRDYGSENDVGEYAAAIQTTRSGDLVVPEQVKSAILELRSDPILSAKLAAENMKRERVVMEAQLGRRATSADLYLMHVLGPAGATRFLEAVAKQPNKSSLKVASLKVLRNAGLLARDGRPLTVANTYAAAKGMLDSQQQHSALLLASAKDANASAPVVPPAPMP